MKRFNVDPNSSEMIEAVTLGALMILDILEHSDRYDVIPSDNEQDKQAETYAIMARECLKE